MDHLPYYIVYFLKYVVPGTVVAYLVVRFVPIVARKIGGK
jgi:hypothetical protein